MVDRSAFLGSLFLARLADQLLLFLVPLVVFQVTQQATWSGLAFFIETLPRFIAFPICGALSDRVSPIRELRTSQASRAVACCDVGCHGHRYVSAVRRFLCGAAGRGCRRDGRDPVVRRAYRGIARAARYRRIRRDRGWRSRDGPVGFDRDVRCRFPDGRRFRQDVQHVHPQRAAGDHPPLGTTARRRASSSC